MIGSSLLHSDIIVYPSYTWLSEHASQPEWMNMPLAGLSLLRAYYSHIQKNIAAVSGALQIIHQTLFLDQSEVE